MPPTYPGIRIEENPSGGHSIQGVPTSVTAFVGRARKGPINQPEVVTSFRKFTRMFGGLWPQSTMSYAVQQFFANGGTQAIIVRVSHRKADGQCPTAYTTSRGDSPRHSAADTGQDGSEISDDDVVGDPTAKTGIYALEKTDLFNILCIPPLTAGERGKDLKIDTWTKAAEFCRLHRAFLIVDAPNSWKVDSDENAVIAGIAAFSNAVRENGAIYFPRLKSRDPNQGDRLEHFAPCGAVAGLIARTDSTGGVWKAPAGLQVTLQGVTELAVDITDGQNGQLNALGINCLRNFPATGTVCWGARTLAGQDSLNSEWKYIPVRRTALFIEESLFRGTQWIVFEPNDEPLWAKIRQSVGAFMIDLFRQGAFQGSKPEEAFFVKCDEQTTTPDDRNRKVVNILVGFAPLRPTEFVIIKISQRSGGMAG